MRRVIVVCALALALGSGQSSWAGAPQKSDPVSGWWEANLTIPAGEVAFGLDLELRGAEVRGAVLNGPERQEFTSGAFDGATLTLRFDYYDGQITARLEAGDGAVFVGEYTRQTSQGIGRYPFKAVRRPPAPKWEPAKGSGAAGLSGEWLLTLRGQDGKVLEVDPAVFAEGTPRRGDSTGTVSVTGTVIPVSGDYGLLAGSTWREKDARKFRLSRFDGIHVMMMTGELKPNGTIEGEIASGKSYRVSVTGARKGAESASGAVANPNELTSMKNPAEAFRFSGTDSAGKTVASTDSRFAGKVVVVDVFGTWCPNCHDEAPVLADLYRRYRKDGLEVVGLAYEYTDDAARNRRQIDVYRRKHRIEFPLLLAGTTAEGEIARTLPQLANFGAYPTTIFVGRDGRVRKIHAGFAGPATGNRFVELKRELEETVRELLKK